MYHQDRISPDLIDRKVALGTGNIALGPAMTKKQALQALQSGAEIVEAELGKGLDILAIGDVSIGNTTPSLTIEVALTGRSFEIAGFACANQDLAAQANEVYLMVLGMAVPLHEIALKG